MEFGCRWCEQDFETSKDLHAHANEAHTVEYLKAVRRPAPRSPKNEIVKRLLNRPPLIPYTP